MFVISLGSLKCPVVTMPSFEWFAISYDPIAIKCQLFYIKLHHGILDATLSTVALNYIKPLERYDSRLVNPDIGASMCIMPPVDSGHQEKSIPKQLRGNQRWLFKDIDGAPTSTTTTEATLRGFCFFGTGPRKTRPTKGKHKWRFPEIRLPQNAKTIHFLNRIFPYKPSNFGYPPFQETPK